MKNSILLVSVALVALMLAGCPGDSGPLDSGGTDTSSLDAPRTDTGGGGDVGDVDGGGGTDTGGVDGGGTDPDGGGTDPDGGPIDLDGGGAPVCRDNGDCSRSQYCATATGSCRAPGVCTVRPISCDLSFDPVCGCDGIDYGNPCAAAAAGVNVASRGMCAVSTCDLRPAGGCCFDDADCPGRTTRCVNEECRAGGEGTCVAEPAGAACWEDSDCRTGTCMGARICPCGALCLLPDAPGSCSTITPGP